jgi:hypothetical protein
MKAADLLEFESSIDDLKVQKLEDITEILPIYEKLADINKQQEELKVIYDKFNIEFAEPGQLWKMLLKKRASEEGIAPLYSDLSDYLQVNNLSIVSLHHFQNNWLDPDSELLAPITKKVFFHICKYLGLPNSYYIIIQRIKNASKQNTRNNTKRINGLFKDLFNDKCFDDVKMARSILEARNDYYKSNHSLEEIGIDENHLIDNLIALVEMVEPEIKLKSLKQVELINNE